jgi:2-polyprenyl-3-methyl-5-hydroxy-6-metoxy-1,4-benzoquinol methylase
MRHVQTRELVTFLRSTHGKKESLIDRVKTVYRPYICPFDDLLNLIPENQMLLDIGCGAGTFLQLVAKYRRPQTLAGLETRTSLIDSARSSLSEVSREIPTRLEVYNGSDIPLWISHYNCVLLIDVLHHLRASQQFQFLRNLFSILKPGAQLIIKDIDAQERFWCMFNKLHDIVVSRELSHEMGACQVESVLREIGFRTCGITKKRLIVYPHFTIVGKKD